MRKICGVYAIRNTETHDMYVGGSKNIVSRWSVHRTHLRQNRHHSIILQDDWIKFGEDAFEVVVVEEVLYEQLREREQYYITTLRPLYNISSNAQSAFHDPEIQARLPRGRDAREYLPEHGAKISAALKGKKLSAAHRAKISEVQRGKVIPEEQRQKISASLKGKSKPPRDEVARKNMSDAIRAKWQDPEWRAKALEAQKKTAQTHVGRKRSEETRRKMREAWERRRQKQQQDS